MASFNGTWFLIGIAAALAVAGVVALGCLFLIWIVKVFFN